MPPDAFQTLPKHRISSYILDFTRITASPASADGAAALADGSAAIGDAWTVIGDA